MLNYENIIARSKVESAEKWDNIISKVPMLNFKEKWDVKIIPPFAGAVARFTINKDGEQVCSVYLDWYNRLGIYGSPYYELYPFEDDIKRYSLEETKELMEDINNIWECA